MKLKFILFLILTTFSLSAQGFKVSFEKLSDTIYSSNNREITNSFVIKIPKQDIKYKDVTVSFEVMDSEFEIKSDIYFPVTNSFVFDNKKDTLKDFKIKFLRKNKHDRVIKLKIIAKDKDSNILKLDPEYKDYTLFIEPFVLGQSGYEFWLFTGTNLDFLDGIKAQELYFKGNFLYNFKKNEESTRHWVNVSFGKNRYFNDVDSLSNVPFSERLPSLAQDTVTIANGYYNALKKVETNNVFFNIDYLYNIESLSSSKSKSFLTLDFSISLQNISTQYKNDIFISDTMSYPISLYSKRYPSIKRYSKIKQINKSVGIGCAYFLTEDKINIKTFLSGGLNYFSYPYKIVQIYGETREENYENTLSAFFLFRMDATVLNPGITLGFETLLRNGTVPLFNVTLSKVIEFEQISNLFNTVPSAK